MFVRTILLYSLFLFVNGISYSQNEDYLNKFIVKRINYEKKYIRQAKHQMKKSLRKDDWWCSYTSKREKFSMREVDFLVVPMFTFTKEAEKYSSNDEFFKYINIWKRPLFHDVFMFRNEKYYGTLGYDDLGCCGMADLVVSEKDFYPKSFLKTLKKFKSLKPEYVFYIRGILHAWWYIKDDKVFVYFKNKVYNYKNFLKKYYSEKEIRKIAEWNNTYPLVKLKY